MAYINFVYGLVIMMMSLSSSASTSTSTTASAGASTSVATAEDSTSTTTSAEEVGETEDLLIQILFRLPVKSLLRFKCVSKRWKSIISTPYFSINHTRRNPKPISSSLLMLNDRSLILLSLGNHENNTKADYRIPSFGFFNITADVTMRILGMCNGLMLCFITSAFKEHEYAYCVGNITTKQLRKLPPPSMLASNLIIGMNLAFDPSNSPHFKVICVGQHFMQDAGSCEIEIYSSETDEWKLWNGSFCNPFDILEVFDRGVFCNGAMHWLNFGGDSFYFVLENEVMKIMPMPPMHSDIYTTKRLRFLGQSGGYLHLVDFESNLYHNPPMDIYEMRKDYSGWILKHRFDPNNIAMEFPEMTREIRVNTQYTDDENDTSIHTARYYLCSIMSTRRAPDGESIEVILLLPSRIIAYNPKDNSSRTLLVLKKRVAVQDHKWYDVHQFTETLSWL
ncbi:F-box protein At5g07610-like [Coffea eugenioides]|uniref:F-box protein At5g07610-like n=1 Tax=Coffea arabica TaxID=13443 RepID=A0A6P6SZT7_COFAR|nr:F-box protein At5g07610-like [Coffea arabica]XP_027071569.1 F-box protein At5g07610-like [Coffea arabica]XP_027174026.1 F-box protein At5g07610-like [Coffea eugenioides]